MTTRSLKRHSADVVRVAGERSEQQADPPAISMEQMTSAINEVSRYVKSRMSRSGHGCEVEDALQDIHIAVWRGVAEGHYRQIPGIRFGAWVQGIAAHICSAYLSKAHSKDALPLFIDPADCKQREVGGQLELLPEGVAEREWALCVLRTTRRHVGDVAWNAAMSILLADDRVSAGSTANRRSYRHLVFVRQMAITVRQALAAVDAEGRDIGEPTTFVARCLPTPLLQHIAQDVIRLDLHKAERAEAIAVIASDFGVSRRYVEVQIGRARQLYAAATEITAPILQPVPKADLTQPVKRVRHVV